MLILRRKPGETFLIGADIKITVLSSDLNGTRLAIEAPKEVPILRSELLGAMDANREAASGSSQPQSLLTVLTQLHGTEGEH